MKQYGTMFLSFFMHCSQKKHVSLHINKLVNDHSIMRFTFSIILCLSLFASCSYETEILTRMDEIKQTGDNDPELALRMLDSLQADIYDHSTYVQHKFQLLNIRLNDKAYKMPTSDILIKKLVDYFLENGSDKEKQEVLYYAGSVYRDLNDTPKALEFFHRSKDIALEQPEACDSLMLANTYSNLSCLYYSVQDYENALKSGRDEWRMFASLKRENPRTLIHIGTSLVRKDELKEAAETFTQALHMLEQDSTANDADLVSALLYHFSYLKMPDEATASHRLMSRLTSEELYTADDYLALGEYFILSEHPDSASYCYRQILDRNLSSEGVFNASKLLFSLSDQAGNIADAVKYARIFVNENNTLNMGKRQELAATVNNQYQYHRNQREEQQLKAENSRNRSLLFMVILCSVLLMTALLLYVFYKKNRRLKTQVGMQNELLQLKKDKSELEQEIDQQQTQIELLKEDLHAKENQMNHYLSEIERYDRDSAEKEKELKEKIEQNQSLIGMLNQLQFTVSNEDIIQKVKKASFGQYKMTTDDWNAFCGTIDMLYPSFKDKLAEKLGKFSRNQMLVCYLMRIGINPPQIQQLLNLPKTTVWRWVTRYKEVLKSEWISASGS